MSCWLGTQRSEQGSLGELWECSAPRSHPIWGTGDVPAAEQCCGTRWHILCHRWCPCPGNPRRFYKMPPALSPQRHREEALALSLPSLTLHFCRCSFASPGGSTCAAPAHEPEPGPRSAGLGTQPRVTAPAVTQQCQPATPGAGHNRGSPRFGGQITEPRPAPRGADPSIPKRCPRTSEAPAPAQPPAQPGATGDAEPGAAGGEPP